MTITNTALNGSYFWGWLRTASIEKSEQQQQQPSVQLLLLPLYDWPDIVHIDASNDRRVGRIWQRRVLPFARWEPAPTVRLHGGCWRWPEREVRENVRGVTRVSVCNYNTWAWQYEVYYMQSSASHPRTPASMHGSMFHVAPRLPANDRSTPYASDISSYFIRDTLRGNEFDL